MYQAVEAELDGVGESKEMDEDEGEEPSECVNESSPVDELDMRQAFNLVGLAVILLHLLWSSALLAFLLFEPSVSWFELMVLT